MATIKGKKKDKGPKDPDIDVDVDNSDYEAYSKDDLPPDGNYTVGDKTVNITWFVNFGIREKKTKKEANVSYTVKLKELDAGKSLFVRYKDSPSDAEPKVHKLTTENAGSGFIKFKLSIGDPPLGSGP